MFDNIQPIIIMGMHRSGTTMITRILERLGLFVGWNVQRNQEALFFGRRNERLQRSCGGGWDNPAVIDKLLRHSKIRKKALDLLKSDIESTRFYSYMGPKYYSTYRKATNFNIPWGWKDPRNTFLLPLWLDLFPKAKIIHIYRNGIDVANSLTVRDNKLEKKAVEKDSFLKRNINFLKEKGFLLFLYERFYEIHRDIDPLRKYNQLRLYSYMSLEKGFELWCTYMARALENIEIINNEVLNIQYEDFMQEPQPHLKDLVHFCGLEVKDVDLKEIPPTLNSKRCYAFKSDPNSMRFYDTVKDNDLMRILGY